MAEIVSADSHLPQALVTGTEVTASGLILDFIKIVGIGALVGAGVGAAVSQVIKLVDDPMIEITLTTIAAYGSFVERDPDFGRVTRRVAHGIGARYPKGFSASGFGRIDFRAQGLFNGRHFDQEIIVLYIRFRPWISRSVAVKRAV